MRMCFNGIGLDHPKFELSNRAHSATLAALHPGYACCGNISSCLLSSYMYLKKSGTFY